jgi:DNA-directed RNA polymerase subunit F
MYLFLFCMLQLHAVVVIIKPQLARLNQMTIEQDREIMRLTQADAKHNQKIIRLNQINAKQNEEISRLNEVNAELRSNLNDISPHRSTQVDVSSILPRATYVSFTNNALTAEFRSAAQLHPCPITVTRGIMRCRVL